MKVVCRYLQAILLYTAFAALACGEQPTSEVPAAQSSAAQSSPSADGTAGNDKPAFDPARLAERDRLREQADQLRADGKLPEAIAKFEEVLTLERDLFGDDHEKVVGSLQQIAAWHEEAENFAAAKQALQTVLEIKTKRLGDDNWQVIDANRALADFELRSKLTPDQRNRLAAADDASQKMEELYQQGQYAEAIPWAERAVEGHKEILGKYHPVYATSLSHLGLLYYSLGEYERALPRYDQAVAIHQQAFGENHPETAMDLNNLAMLYQSNGDYARALPLHNKALAIRRRTVGDNHPETAMGFNNLALLYSYLGDYPRALPMFEKALAINKLVLGENHLHTAYTINNLAMLYWSQGDDARALLLNEQALSIFQQAFGEKHPHIAITLQNRGLLYASRGDYDQALPLYERALSIYRYAFPEDHPSTATTLQNLGLLHGSRGDYDRALPLCQQALAIRRVLLGDKHPDTAVSLQNLAWVYGGRGDDAHALPLCQQALAVRKEVLGENHPDTATNLHNLGMVFQSMGERAKADLLYREAVEISRRHLELTAAAQSERQQLDHLKGNRDFVDALISFSLSGSKVDASTYEHILNWKGATLRRQRQLRLVHEAGNPNERKLWNDLQVVATRLATISLDSPQPDQVAAWRRQVAEMTEKKERLEGELSQRSAEFRQLQAQTKLTPNALRAALPPDVAFVDLLEFSRLVTEMQQEGFPIRKWERRLVAFVLGADSPVVAVDLGLADPINAAAVSWRENVGEFSRDERDDGRRLRQLVWEPLVSHLEGATTVLISPDGALASIPWGALPGSEPDTYLLEERAIVVVPVPQLIPEMLREQGIGDSAKPSLLVLGHVDHSAKPGTPMLLAGTQTAPRPTDKRAGLFGAWENLSETRPEIDAIKRSFGKKFPPANVTELRAAEATEEAFRQQAGKHRFLHLATHGFFAPPEIRSALAPDRTRDGAMGAHSDLFGERGVVGFHPGLLSGIVLAGANLPPEPERDDGILTALEVGALDLRNVDLVTLSACETGLGEMAGGEGILGLQRAFQIAGTRTTVTSLWKVNDDATRALMIEFYKNLWERKLPRIEALRQAQLAMLNRYDAKSHTLRGPGGIVAIDPEELAELHKGSANDGNSRTPPAYWAAFVLSGDWR